MIRKDQGGAFEEPRAHKDHGHNTNSNEPQGDQDAAILKGLRHWKPDEFFEKFARGELEPGFYLFILPGGEKS